MIRSNYATSRKKILTTSQYDSFYALLKKKFQILWNYLLKNLALNCICEFFNLIKTSILFVFKKNESLRLCVNYRNLNTVIIKNKCFFFNQESVKSFDEHYLFYEIWFQKYLLSHSNSKKWWINDHFSHAI